MTDLAHDERLAALLDTTTRITGPGMPFEIVEEEVLGERLPVYVNRAHSMREILLGAARFGGRDCYVFSDGFRLPFDQLVPQVASLATALRDTHGIGAGDRVAVCAANCREWLMTFWAVAALDAVLVAMNGWWTGAEMRNALELTQPKLLVMDEKRRARLDGDPGFPLLETEHDFTGLFDDTTASLPDHPIAEDDPFILIFTSGTTGRPKAAVLSHRSVISYLMEQSFIAARGMAMAGVHRSAAAPPPSDSPDSRPPTVRLAPYPLFHVSGMSMAVSTVMAGTPPCGRSDGSIPRRCCSSPATRGSRSGAAASRTWCGSSSTPTSRPSTRRRSRASVWAGRRRRPTSSARSRSASRSSRARCRPATDRPRRG